MRTLLDGEKRVLYELARIAILCAIVGENVDNYKASILLRYANISRSKFNAERLVSMVKFAVKYVVDLRVKYENGKILCPICLYMLNRRVKLQSIRALKRHISENHRYWLNMYIDELIRKYSTVVYSSRQNK